MEAAVVVLIALSCLHSSYGQTVNRAPGSGSPGHVPIVIGFIPHPSTNNNNQQPDQLPPHNNQLPGQVPPSNNRPTGQLPPPHSNQFPGQLPPNNNQFPGQLPPNNNQFPGQLPPNNNQFPGHLPPNNNQFPGQLPPNNNQLPGPLPPHSNQFPGQSPPNNNRFPSQFPPNNNNVPTGPFPGQVPNIPSHVSPPRPVQPTIHRCACQTIPRPVCATNQRTYNNLCELNCVAGTDLTVYFLHDGPCRTPTTSTAPPKTTTPRRTTKAPPHTTVPPHTTAPPCRNRRRFRSMCRTFVNDNFCERFTSFMMFFCPRACKFC